VSPRKPTPWGKSPSPSRWSFLGGHPVPAPADHGRKRGPPPGHRAGTPAGAAVDAGVSETTDLQARAILTAAAISGKLTPVHLLVAQALLRTPAISVANAESAGAAIAAGAEALAQVLASDSLTGDQLPGL